MNHSLQENQSLPLWRKLGYACGNIGGAYSWVFISTFLLIFCTNVLGISAGVVGTLLLISKILDGISDIIMGRIIDVTKSKMGKARFWYFVSIVPCAICVFLLFSIPASFTENTMYIYVFIIYTLMGAVFYTANNIAYSTMIALSTKNQKDQFTMSSYSMLFALIATMVLSFTTTNIVEAFGGGKIGWQYTALLYAAISVVVMLIPVLAIRELPEEVLKPRNSDNTIPQEEKMNLFKVIRILLKDKYFVLVTLLYAVGFLNAGFTTSIGIYYATYALGNASLLGALSMATVVPLVFCMPFMPKIVAKIGMRKSNLIGTIISIIGGVFVLIGQPIGLGTILAGLVIKTLGTLPGSATYAAYVAAIDEHNYMRTGHRMTGSMFSCSSVGTKVGQGLGTALCGLLLDLGGFDGLAATQTSSAITTIIAIYVIAPIVCAIAQFILYYLLDVEKANKKLMEEKALRSNTMYEESAISNS